MSLGLADHHSILQYLQEIDFHKICVHKRSIFEAVESFVSPPDRVVAGNVIRYHQVPIRPPYVSGESSLLWHSGSGTAAVPLLVTQLLSHSHIKTLPK
jgi:hypothetical protein